MQITDMQEEIQKLKAELNYSEYAKHLMRKYEALTDAGFSHDDAMCLIPMWDDADFENFKKGN